MYSNLKENIFLPDLEKEILQTWRENDTFKNSINLRSDEKTFTFYEGPPTANGMPGIHHVISRAIKDIVCRYKTMNGYRVYRKAGWDTQGLPVEIEVEKKLGIKSKKEIEEYGTVKFNNACKDSIFIYLKQWEELTERMGYWIDLKDAYVTYHNEYIESVWWALKKFFDEGLIYKGFKILPFCPLCESPLSSHEVAQGYQDLKDPSVYVKFKIKSGEFENASFLVWTTTPWTLPSNAALSVNPDVVYVLIKTSSGENLILAKERLDVIKDDYQIEKELTGKELEFIEYEPLFDFFTTGNPDDKKAFFVTLGDFVTTEDGTGIVHIAPSFGEDDYQIGLKYDLPVLQAVGRNGLFKANIIPYAGKNFKEADPEIIQDLKEQGKLYRKEMFVHSYPHCWRHRVPLMYYATDSWFINTSSYKQKMIGLNKTINWHPPEFGSGRFGNWLEENKDWAVSRNRFWGTPLPIWYHYDEDGKTSYEAIGSVNELKEKAVNFDEVYSNDTAFDLHKPYIDEIKIKSADGKIMKRVPEVIDCWFDSGSMPFAQHHYPFENEDLFKKNFPADFIAEGLDQTRGWFYSLHAISTFLFDQPAYKNLIVNGMILDKNGKKMAKSLGNAVDPFEMINKYGADVLRWYLIYSSPVGKEKLFNEDEIIEIRNKFFDTLLNTYKFFVIYSNNTGFNYGESKKIPFKDRRMIDRWILSKLNSTRKQFFELMENYDITKATRIIYDFTIDELSNWYVRRNRKRFRNPENEVDKLSGYQTLYEVIYDLLKMIAPFSPFVSDFVFMKLNQNKESVHLSLFEKVNENEIDLELEEEMKFAQKIVYLARAVRAKNNLKVRQPLKQLLVPVLDKDVKEKIERVKDIILDEINVKELKIIEGDSGIIKKKAKANFKSIGPKFGKDVKTVQNIITGLSSQEVNGIESKGSIEINGFSIERSDIEILTENIEGWIIESHDDITIALDTKLDETLIEEGIVREFINRIQNFRKNQDYDVNDKVNVIINTTGKIEQAIEKYKTFIKNETMSENIEITGIPAQAGNGKHEFQSTDIHGEICKIYMEKI